MLKPPFELAALTSATSATATLRPTGCCDEHDSPPPLSSPDAADTPAASRARLIDLDSHLHCSVIGTCLTTGELRKTMARFLFVRDSTDLEVHHEAVALAARGGHIAKALNKLLDQRHEAVVKRFARARDTQVLATLWDEALRQGEIPGAYWATLTHRDVSPELRKKVFGDVHMLSHLVGAANRADIRRLVALERENTELRERADKQQLRSQELAEERERSIMRLEQELADARHEAAQAKAAAASPARPAEELAAAAALVALQTQRREHAERAVAVTAEDAARLRDELEHLGRHAQALHRELAAAETQLREVGDAGSAESPNRAPNRALDAPLRGKRIFYVGGRPSSTPAIRDLVLRHGGEFQRHDGGLEDRKGLLVSGVAWAELVVFPVDCIDHDSAGNLKRLCTRLGIAYLPLRSASVASFAAALANPANDDDGGSRDEGGSGICLKHG